MGTTAAWILGAHLITIHTSDGPQVLTPGLYLSSPTGITAGILRNSYGHLGGYAGWTWQTAGQPLSLALTAGGIAGYKAQTVRPMLVPSLRMRLGRDAGIRLSFLPRSPYKGRSDALTLSLESSY
jgi:hypothetical protein